MVLEFHVMGGGKELVKGGGNITIREMRRMHEHEYWPPFALALGYKSMILFKTEGELP